MRTFRLVLRTPDHVFYDGPARFLSARAVDGTIGVLAGHEPLLTALEVGLVKADTGNGERMWAAGDSLMNVQPDATEILTDYAVEVPGAEEAMRKLDTVREWYRSARRTAVSA